VDFVTHWLGPLSDDFSLALAYNSADVFVLPSRQDNLPLTGIEAHACGCPVVAFDCGGLRDIVVHEETGCLARPYDPVELANGIAWVLERSQRDQDLSKAARHRAECMWSYEVVIPQYIATYEETIKAHS